MMEHPYPIGTKVEVIDSNVLSTCPNGTILTIKECKPDITYGGGGGPSYIYKFEEVIHGWFAKRIKAIEPITPTAIVFVNPCTGEVADALL